MYNMTHPALSTIPNMHDVDVTDGRGYDPRSDDKKKRKVLPSRLVRLQTRCLKAASRPNPIGATRSRTRLRGGQGRRPLQTPLPGPELKIISQQSAETLPQLTKPSVCKTVGIRLTYKAATMVGSRSLRDLALGCAYRCSAAKSGVSENGR
jgi:hypothetical protein